MIDIKVTKESQAELYFEVSQKIDAMKELTSIAVKKDLMDTAFSLAALKFVKTTNMYARSNKSLFHHVYEWEAVGNESGRLFRIIKRNSSGGSATVYTKFNNSKKSAPISPALKVPGNTGRIVSKSGVFKNKAEVMESGSPVQFITTRTIAFSPKNSGIVFIPPGKTINIKNPGGSGVKGSFNRHFNLWWKTFFPTILDDSMVIPKIEKNVAKALNKRNATRYSVRDAVFRTTATYKTIGSII